MKQFSGKRLFFASVSLVVLIMMSATIFTNDYAAGASSLYTEGYFWQNKAKKTFSVNKLSAIADGSDSIVLTGGFYMTADLSTSDDHNTPTGSMDNPVPYCFSDYNVTNGQTEQMVGDLDFIVSGDATTIIGDGIHGHSAPIAIGGKNYIDSGTDKINCVSGKVSVTLRSTSPGTKKVGIGFLATADESMSGIARVDYDLTLEVAFTAPGSGSTSTSSKTKTTTPVVTVAKPAVPVLATINTIALPADKTFIQTIHVGDPIILTGTTTPNSTVKLTFYSDPVTAEVKSDVNGAWTYTLAKALPMGDHRVEAQVTDASGAVSDTAEIAKFSIKAKPIIIEPSGTPRISYGMLLSPLTYGLIGLAIILLAVLIYLIIRRRKIAKKLNNDIH